MYRILITLVVGLLCGLLVGLAIGQNLNGPLLPSEARLLNTGGLRVYIHPSGGGAYFTSAVSNPYGTDKLPEELKDLPKEIRSVNWSGTVLVAWSKHLKTECNSAHPDTVLHLGEITLVGDEKMVGKIRELMNK